MTSRTRLETFAPVYRRKSERHAAARLAVVVGLAAVLAGCEAPSASNLMLRQVTAEETRWNALKIHDYTLDTRDVPGFIVPGPRNDSLRVTVRQDTIQSVYDLQSHTYVAPTLGITVPQLFVSARGAIMAAAAEGTDARAVVGYDPTYHYPTSVLSPLPDEGGRIAGALMPIPH